jgi:hypothetical protein
MASNEPKPLIIRLLLFVVCAYCGVTILTVGIFMPFALVANWGTNGGPSPSPGLFELLFGLAILVAGFGLPALVLSKQARGWKLITFLALVLGGWIIWALADGVGSLVFFLVFWVVAALHGLAFFAAFTALSGRQPPKKWQDLP